MLIQDFPFLETTVAGFLAFALGLFWYHPKVMGKRWLEARGKSVDDVRPTTFPHIVSFVLWMLASCFYSFLVLLLGLESSPALICLSCLLWVAFAMPPTVMGAFFTGYPFNAVAIDSAYQLGGYYLFAMTHIVLGMVL